MDAVIYRQLIPADHNEYKRVRLDCLKEFPDHFGSTYEEEFDSSSHRLTNAIHKADEYNFVYGVFTEIEKLIGICGFVTGSRWKTRHRGEIVQLYVDRAYNGFGIGEKLMQKTIAKAFENEGTEMILLAVVSTNKKAIKLYENLGFKKYGELENYFKSGREYTAQSFFYLAR